MLESALEAAASTAATSESRVVCASSPSLRTEAHAGAAAQPLRTRLHHKQ
jgi:hypothetical protein